MLSVAFSHKWSIYMWRFIFVSNKTFPPSHFICWIDRHFTHSTQSYTYNVYNISIECLLCHRPRPHPSRLTTHFPLLFLLLFCWKQKKRNQFPFNGIGINVGIHIRAHCTGTRLARIPVMPHRRAIFGTMRMLKVFTFDWNGIFIGYAGPPICASIHFALIQFIFWQRFFLADEIYFLHLLTYLSLERW